MHSATVLRSLTKVNGNMAYWIFKLSDQEIYPDELGVKYVYDNRHSIHVAPGDSYLLYLDKRGGRYSFNGHGGIGRVWSRKPTPAESVTPRLRKIYSAQLVDYCGYSSPLDIRPDSTHWEGSTGQYWE